MVSLESNIYALREHIRSKVFSSSYGEAIKLPLLVYLGMSDNILESNDNQDFIGCAIDGFNNIGYKSKLVKLIGMSHEVEGTPMPWVSDIWGMFGVKLSVRSVKDTELDEAFVNWAKKFLLQRIKDKRLNIFEEALARFIINDLYDSSYASSSIILFLNYKKLYKIEDKKPLIDSFYNEFKMAHEIESPLTLAVLLYVFDKINEEHVLVPPNLWSFEDLIKYLKNIPLGLNSWTWEDKAKTKNSKIVKWEIENEYHVQNLLYVVLAPIFNDIQKELNVGKVGHNNPREDLYIPQIDTIIEVKYRKDKKKTFQMLTGELAEDLTLYKSEDKFKDSKIIAFLWDNLRSTEEHNTFYNGVMTMKYDGCIVVSSPSFMD